MLITIDENTSGLISMIDFGQADTDRTVVIPAEGSFDFDDKDAFALLYAMVEHNRELAARLQVAAIEEEYGPIPEEFTAEVDGQTIRFVPECEEGESRVHWEPLIDVERGSAYSKGGFSTSRDASSEHEVIAAYEEMRFHAESTASFGN